MKNKTVETNISTNKNASRVRNERARLADRLIAARCLWTPAQLQANSQGLQMSVHNDSHVLGVLQSLLKRAVVLDYQNVAEYMGQEEAKDWTLLDLPCVMPPFPAIWLETRASGEQHDGATLRSSGILFITDELRTWGEMPERMLSFLASLRPTWLQGEPPSSYLQFPPTPRFDPGADQGTQTPSRLVVGVCVLEAQKGESLRVDSVLGYVLGQDGDVLSHLRSFSILPEMGRFMDWGGFATQRALNATVKAQAFPALLALSFCHSLSVRVQEDAPSEKFSLAWQRRHGAPLVTSNSLDIQEIVRMLEGTEDGQGHRAQVGLQGALRLVSSHFTPGEVPLFRRQATAIASGSLRGDER